MLLCHCTCCCAAEQDFHSKTTHILCMTLLIQHPLQPFSMLPGFCPFLSKSCSPSMYVAAGHTQTTTVRAPLPAAECSPCCELHGSCPVHNHRPLGLVFKQYRSFHTASTSRAQMPQQRGCITCRWSTHCRWPLASAPSPMLLLLGPGRWVRPPKGSTPAQTAQLKHIAGGRAVWSAGSWLQNG